MLFSRFAQQGRVELRRVVFDAKSNNQTGYIMPDREIKGLLNILIIHRAFGTRG